MVECIRMQNAVGWLVVAVLIFGIWRLRRVFKRMVQSTNKARAEALSHAISEAVASGVAQALSAAVADARAAATGGNVSVVLGDNLARCIADNYDRAADHDNNGSHNYDIAADHDDDRPAVHEPADRRGMGSLSDGSRHGELASRRAIRTGDSDSASRRNIRKQATDRE